MSVILVTGSRDWTEVQKVHDALAEAAQGLAAPIHLVQGGARGADLLAKQFGLKQGWKVTTVPAEWGVYGKGAGPRRNQDMIDKYTPQVAVVFHKNQSRGTQDCLTRLRSSQKERGFPSVINVIL